jgi:hypothetical protein
MKAFISLYNFGKSSKYKKHYMDYTVDNIVWDVDTYTSQKVNLSLPKSLIVSSGSIKEVAHNNFVETKQAIINYLQSLYGFGIKACLVCQLMRPSIG